MSTVSPFAALYYNPKIVKDFSKVVCPPYDVINSQQKESFKKSSPYNFCNILITDKNKNYRQLSQMFSHWVNQDIMIRDRCESFYLCQQKFSFDGGEHRRYGILGLLRMDKPGLIHPHESTFAGPKKDRYQMLKHFKANLSPIFIITPGKIQALADSCKTYQRRKPLIEFKDFASIENKLWRISNKEMIERIKRGLAHKKLFIADGHHRFEVAHRYFKDNKGKYRKLNYVLAYFTDAESGLLVLPTHRIIKDTSLTKIRQKVGDLFNIVLTDKRKIINRFDNQKSSHDKPPSLGLVINDRFYFLELKNRELLDKISSKDIPSVYRNLEVYLFHKFVFSKFDKQNISYTHSIPEAIKSSGKRKASFILKATPLEDVFKVARAGRKMPQKSTYFFPKLLSGLVVRKFQET
jgi:uncharacterized protein (DUF1015 family)